MIKIGEHKQIMPGPGGRHVWQRRKVFGESLLILLKASGAAADGFLLTLEMELG